MEKEIESAGCREKLMMADLTKARTLQKCAEHKLENQIQQHDLWFKSMIDIAKCFTAQITKWT